MHLLHGIKQFINQEIKMYYSVSVDHNSMATFLTRSDREGFLEVLHIEWNEWGLTMIDVLWYSSEEDGNV